MVGQQTKYEIAILDNNEIEALLRMENKGIPTISFLDAYDYVLIPGWVWEEVLDSEYRRAYIETLQQQGCPVFIVPEKRYIEILPQELKLLELYDEIIRPCAQLKTFF